MTGRESGAQVVLVTGAAGGIGQAICERFARDGWLIAAHCHSRRAAADAMIAKLPGGPHAVFQADISSADANAILIADVLDTFGRIDVLVNNAAIAPTHRILDIDLAEWERVWAETMATNLSGPAHLCYLAAQQMVWQDGGRIINISSRGAFRGEPDMPAYGASKAGINALSQSLAKALAPHHVYVYAVAPGWVDTARVAPKLSGANGEAILRDAPMGRVASPAEVANTVAFLSSVGAESLTGAIIDVNGASYLR